MPITRGLLWTFMFPFVATAPELRALHANVSAFIEKTKGRSPGESG